MSEHPRHAMVQEATTVTEAVLEPQRIPVNMYEGGDAVVVVAPLPAVMPEDVTITRSGRTLTIHSGLRSAGPKDYLIHEWSYGAYEREVNLPPGFAGQVEASLANGQLAVRVLRGEDEGRGEQTIHPVHPIHAV
jgi:HSP20 family molecular chaperone IbpA